jgi:ankyrin repeat protein
MCTAIIPCKNFAPIYPNDGISTLLHAKTTVEAFKQKSRTYMLFHGDRHGCHPLFRAAHFGNLPLILHIFQEGGPSLLALGNKNGLTPLHGATSNFQWKAAFLLLKLGSPINILTTGEYLDSDYESVPADATPLDIAVRTHYVPLIQLLLMNGGECHLALGIHQFYLNTAQQNIDANRNKLIPQISAVPCRELVADYALQDFDCIDGNNFGL